MSGSGAEWRSLAAGMKVLTLSLPVRLLVPPLFIQALPRSAIGFSFEGGRIGAALGSLLLFGSLAIAGILYPVAGVLGAVLPLWVLGTAGAAMVTSSLAPLAFVKPLCRRCRLLPVVAEHEAIHLSGVESDAAVWSSMKSRHSCESLSLDGDPSICWFCPIQKRLKEH